MGERDCLYLIIIEPFIYIGNYNRPSYINGKYTNPKVIMKNKS